MDYRSQQFNNLLRRELSEIINQKIDFPKGALVTVMKAESSREKKRIDIYISVLPNAFLGKVLRLLNKRSPYLRYLLNKRLGADLPEIKFLFNSSVEIEQDNYEF